MFLIWCSSILDIIETYDGMNLSFRFYWEWELVSQIKFVHLKQSFEICQIGSFQEDHEVDKHIESRFQKLNSKLNVLWTITSCMDLPKKCLGQPLKKGCFPIRRWWNLEPVLTITFLSYLSSCSLVVTNDFNTICFFLVLLFYFWLN